MKKFSFLLGALLMVGNAAFAAHSANYQDDYSKYSKEKLMAELQRLQAENDALKSKVEVTTSEVESTKVELAEVQKKVPVIEPGHERDQQWVNFNLISGNNMHGMGNKKDDTYGEIEIGGRKGAFDMYGYIDFVDALHSESSDYNSDDSNETNFFAELFPRVSLNSIFGKDLSVGPIKEWYIAGYVKAGDSDLWTNGIGIGTDVEVPWFGTMGLNAYALYPEEDFNSSRERDWNGYLIKTNWFKPLYFFENGTFISYQGYANYVFDAGYENSDNFGNTKRSDEEFQWYNGIFFHHNDYAIGYGLKYVHNMICTNDNSDNESTGFDHYITLTYKF